MAEGKNILTLLLLVLANFLAMTIFFPVSGELTHLNLFKNILLVALISLGFSIPACIFHKLGFLKRTIISIVLGAILSLIIFSFFEVLLKIGMCRDMGCLALPILFAILAVILAFINNLLISYSDTKIGEITLNILVIILFIWATSYYSYWFISAQELKKTQQMQDSLVAMGQDIESLYIRDIAVCESFWIKERKEWCSGIIAYKYFECDKTADSLQFNCYEMKALYFSNTSSCFLIPVEKVKESCIFNVIVSSTRWDSTEPDFCNQFSVEEYKSRCISTIASYKNDSNVCAAITSQEYKDTCLYNLVIWGTSSISACDGISAEQMKAGCRQGPQKTQQNAAIPTIQG